MPSRGHNEPEPTPSHKSRKRKHDSSPAPETQRKKSKTKKKKKTKTNRVEKVKTFRKFAKWIGRSENPFISFGPVLRVGMDLVPPEDDEEVVPISPTERAEYMRIYKLIEGCPGWKRIVADIDNGDEKLFNVLVDEMDAGLGAGGAEDRSSLKYDGLRYASPMGFHPAIPFRDDKIAHRGFNHIEIAELLCPIYHVPKFEEDRYGFQQKLLNGEITVSGEDLPGFLYNLDVGFITDNLFYNLLRSPVLVRTWRHLFTGPSTALKETAGYAATKDCQAKLHGMSEVTPRSIAYAAVHIRWFLSNYRDWRINDGVFLLSDFFWTITNLFEQDPTSVWAVETLAWFNEQIFVDKAAKKRTGPSGQTGRERLALHRANGATAMSRVAEKVIAEETDLSSIHETPRRAASPDEREDSGGNDVTLVISNSDTESDSQYDNDTRHMQVHHRRVDRRLTTPLLDTGNLIEDEVQQPIHTPAKVIRRSSTLGSLTPIPPTPQARVKKAGGRKAQTVATATRTLRSRNSQRAGT